MGHCGRREKREEAGDSQGCQRAKSKFINFVQRSSCKNASENLNAESFTQIVNVLSC